MSIVAMKKLRLIAVRSQREELLRELMLLGCVEVSEPVIEPDNELLRSLSRTGGKETALLRAEQNKLLNALKVLDRYAPEKKGLLTPLPEVALDKVLDESALTSDGQIAERILSLEDEVRRVSAEESRERAAIEALLPWKDLSIPLDGMGTKTCAVALGTLPAALPMSEAEAELRAVTQEAWIEEVSADKTLRWVALLCFRDRMEEALNALRVRGFSAVNLAGKGTPEERIAESQAHLAALAAEKEELTGSICALAPQRAALQLGADTLATRIERAENAEKLLNTRSAFCFEGWVTAPDEPRLAQVLEKFDCAWETEDPDPEHPEEVPVKLKNNAVTRPYNMVTEMYSLPAYNGLDPNPFIMPFFALFFGMMFADMAYGLVLLIAGIVITVKAKPRGGMKNMAGLLIEGGIATFLMGFLTGGFFGDAVTQIGAWFGQSWSVVPHFATLPIGGGIDLPLNLLSGNNPLFVLIFAVILGAVHLFFGSCIGTYLKIKDGEWIDAIFNDMSWWVIIAGIGLMALGKGKLVLWIGIGMMVLGNVLTSKGLGKVTGIFGKVYNGATGYLGDFLSYSRLMALMLAGSVIASVFNQLGSLGNKNGITVGGTILFVIVFCIGHALNFALNLIGCFVHTLRLQYLEFFGKWYRDGGRPFAPMRVKTKFVDTIKEE